MQTETCQARVSNARTTERNGQISVLIEFSVLSDSKARTTETLISTDVTEGFQVSVIMVISEVSDSKAV